MKPKGTDLLKTLIKLLAEQEGVKINYTMKGVHNENQKSEIQTQVA